jgi:hypothetical protein
MLGGSLVTTAWRVHRLRMEGRPPDTEGSCEYTEQIVTDSRQGVVLGLGVGLKAPHRKKVICYEMFQSASDLDWFFGTT